MKLRIRANSIRLRLTRTEVAQIGRGESVEERTGFPGGSVFRYALVPHAGVDEPLAEFDDQAIIVTLPVGLASRWADGDEVGIGCELPHDGGATLSLLIEKDFACLKPRRGEDESDMFEHPDPGRC